MTAGTVVITGGILATVILLCIIAVLCYCRLQYYCCKRNESEGEAGSVGDPEPHYCPTCSPYYLRGADEMRNGGERLSYMPAHYENHGATALGLAAMYGPVLSHRSTPDFYTNTRAISTDV
ncbi:hypothetical protein PO909_031177 [Leuciscus waleckii]